MSQSDDATLDSGTVIGGRYRLRRPIGGGGMGLVYEAESIDLGRRCAVKLVRARGSLDAAARLKREAHAVAKLTHPNVVHVFDFVDDETLGPALVMELLTGEPLSGRLARKGALSVAEARAIFGQVLDGLGAAHDAGMIHRDIKPSNLFLVALAGGQVVAKVLDFGIVRWVAPRDDLSLTGSADWLGTPQYMAPEVLLHRPSDERADLYAVGCCLYQALSGQPPFAAENAIAIAHDVVNGPGLPLDRLPQAVPAPVREVIRVATAKDPHTRFATAAEMRAALLASEIRDGEGPEVTTVATSEGAITPSTGGSTATRSRSDRPWLVVAAIGALAALGLGAIVSNARAPTPTTVSSEARPELLEADSPTPRAATPTPAIVTDRPTQPAPSALPVSEATLAAPSAPDGRASQSPEAVPARTERALPTTPDRASTAGSRRATREHAATRPGLDVPETAPLAREAEPTAGTGNTAPRLGEDIVDPYAP